MFRRLGPDHMLLATGCCIYIDSVRKSAGGVQCNPQPGIPEFCSLGEDNLQPGILDFFGMRRQLSKLQPPHIEHIVF